MIAFSQGWALGKDLFALRAKLPVIGKGENTTWVNVARVGEWKGHGQGAFQLTKEVLHSFKKNFDEQANPMMVSWEHGYVPGQPRDAAGWIRELAIRGNELWALVDFTDKAADKVRAKEYLFCSIVFKMNDKHREKGEPIGPTMHELGLTNTPFIDGLKPMELSRVALAVERKTMKDTEIIKAAIKDLGPDATTKQVMMWVEAEKSKDAARSGEVEGDAPAEPEAETAASSDEDDKDDSKQLSTMLADDDAPAEETPDAEAEEAAAAGAVRAIAEAAGLDLPTAIAMMQEKQEELVALLSGQAAKEGGEAEAEATIANSRAVALSNRVETLETELDTLRTQSLKDSIALSVERGELVGSVDELLPAAQKLGIEGLKKLTADLGANVPSGKVYGAKMNQAHKKGGTVSLSSLDPDTRQVVGWLMQDGKKEDEAIALALADKEKN